MTRGRARSLSGEYFSEIDGLRAVAILSVLFFHVGIDGVSGGYVGVDFFFVISGFLITRLIKIETEAGPFSLVQFYYRRARRLLPALFVVIATTTAIAAIAFTPTEFARAAASGVYATLSFSNIYFWMESGYFDVSADLKPFLHTWSLAVEEQFYLIWPVLISFLISRTRYQNQIAILAAIGVSSLFAGELMLTRLPSAVFYLMPFRIFEFAIGAFLALRSPAMSRSQIISEISMGAAWALMIFPIITYDDVTRFPAIGALAPCIGAALAIYGGNARILGAPLRFPIVTWIGRISYSLYLVHWPIFVFAKYFIGSDLSFMQEVAIVIVSIALAGTLERTVEIRFRRPRPETAPLSAKAFAAVCFSCVIFLTAVNSSVWLSGGWLWRYGDVARNFDLIALRNESLSYARDTVQSAKFTSGATKVVVVGDSEARDTAVALSLVSDPAEFQVLFQELDDACSVELAKLPDGLDPTKRLSCEEQFVNAQSSLRLQQADLVVFSALWDEKSAPLIPHLIKYVRAAASKPDLKMVVIGPGDRFMNFHRDALNMLRQSYDQDTVNKAAGLRRWRGIDAIDSTVKRTAEEFGVQYLSRRALMCADDICEFLLDGNMPAIWDHTHWTISGARKFGARLLPSIQELMRKEEIKNAIG